MVNRILPFLLLLSFVFGVSSKIEVAHDLEISSHDKIEKVRQVNLTSIVKASNCEDCHEKQCDSHASDHCSHHCNGIHSFYVWRVLISLQVPDVLKNHDGWSLVSTYKSRVIEANLRPPRIS